MNTPAHAYLRIAEGPDDLLGNEISLTRRLLTLFVAFVLFSGTSLFALAAFDLDHAMLGKAIASSGQRRDDDNSGPGGGGDDDDETDTGTDNANTQSGSSNSDDNGDGESDSSTHQRARPRPR